MLGQRGHTVLALEERMHVKPRLVGAANAGEAPGKRLLGQIWHTYPDRRQLAIRMLCLGGSRRYQILELSRKLIRAATGRAPDVERRYHVVGTI
jgi:hypothetical protein